MNPIVASLQAPSKPSNSNTPHNFIFMSAATSMKKLLNVPYGLLPNRQGRADL
jgi:hypothetical protein